MRRRKPSEHRERLCLPLCVSGTVPVRRPWRSEQARRDGDRLWDTRQGPTCSGSSRRSGVVYRLRGSSIAAPVPCGGRSPQPIPRHQTPASRAASADDVSLRRASSPVGNELAPGEAPPVGDRARAGLEARASSALSPTFTWRAAQACGELRALAVGEAAEGLAGRHAAALQDRGCFDLPDLGDNEQDVEDFCGL